MRTISVKLFWFWTHQNLESELHYSGNMSHFKFDIMMMVGCLLFAARLVSFWQSSGVHPIDIHVDFFPVYSTSTLITANQMNLCSNIPHLCTVSILNKATRFKDFHGSNRLTYLYLFVILCGNSWDIESNPCPDSCNGSSHFPCGYVMPMLGGRTGGFVAILAISGITLTVRACPQLGIVS